MYAAIKGIYENGQIVLQEEPPTTKKSQVLVMFINEQELQSVEQLRKGVKIGSLAGKGYNIPDDFNDPLDDLKEYM